jgi:hypothetical protein
MPLSSKQGPILHKQKPSGTASALYGVKRICNVGGQIAVESLAYSSRSTSIG